MHCMRVYSTEQKLHAIRAKTTRVPSRGGRVSLAVVKGGESQGWEASQAVSRSSGEEALPAVHPNLGGGALRPPGVEVCVDPIGEF